MSVGWILDRLDPVLREQDGFITAAQADRIGVSSAKLDQLLQRGQIRRVRRGVYVLDRLAPIARVDERTYSAWLALDADRLPWERTEAVVVVSHESAAYMHSLGTILDDGAVHLTTPILAKRTRLPGIDLRRSRLSREDWRWEREHHVMVTSPARTMVDLVLLGLERDFLTRAARSVLQSSGRAELLHAIERHPRSSHAPLQWYRAWLEEEAA